jgi:hypothetical protein
MDSLQKFHKKAFSIITIAGFGVIALFLWLQFSNQRESFINNWTSLLSGLVFLISTIICFKYYKKIGDRGGISTTILWTGVANLLYFFGAIAWTYYVYFEGIETPYPSLGDIFFILMPVAYAICVGSLLQIYRSSTKLSTWVISVIVFTALAYIMFVFVGNPEISNELPFWENFFNFAYTLSDSIYVGAGVALLLIAGGKIYKGILIWVLGMFIITIADIVFTHRAAMGIVWDGDIADQLYTLSAIVFTYAIILLSKISDQNKIRI